MASGRCAGPSWRLRRPWRRPCPHRRAVVLHEPVLCPADAGAGGSTAPHRRGVRSTPLLHSWPALMSLRFLGTASSSVVRRDVGAPPVSAPCGSHGADGTSAARLAAAPSFFCATVGATDPMDLVVRRRGSLCAPRDLMAMHHTCAR